MKLSNHLNKMVVSAIMTLLMSHVAPLASAQATTAPSPLDAIHKLNEAFSRNDADIFALADAPVTPEEREFVSAEMAMLTAKGKIDAAYLARFPNVSKTSLPPSIMPGPSIPEERVAAAAVTLIDDRTAEVAIPNGMHYAVALIDGRWRIQVARSIARVYPSDPNKALVSLAKQFRDVAGAYDSVAGQITSGQLASPEAAAGALKERLTPIFQATEAALPQRAWITLPNQSFAEQQKNPGFAISQDSSVRHYDQPALLVSSVSPVKPDASGNAGRQIDVAPYRGKRVRFSAYLKSKDVVNWGGIGLVAMANTGKWLVFDTLSNQPIDNGGAAVRAISGTTDWKQFETVADIPGDAARLMLGIQLYGAGQLWMDDAKIEIVGNDVPTTDDQQVHLNCTLAGKYAAFMDMTNMREGLPALCVASSSAPKGTFCLYGWTDRHPDQYLGHRVRLSAWLKSENVTDGANLKIFVARPKMPDRQIDDQKGERPIRGTTGWTYYEVLADVPADAQCLMPGLNFWGNGKLWIADLKVELADAPATGH